MKVLLSAYSYEPGRGSEPGTGWNIAWELAKYYEVWVLTRPTAGRKAVEAALEQRPVSNIHVIYFSIPFWPNSQNWYSKQLHYYLWQLCVYFAGQRLQREIGFDLINHITFARYWTPNLLALLPVPFILGPVGGGESTPKQFFSDFSLRGQIFERVRNLARWIGEHDPLVRWTAQRSALALATTEETARCLRRIGARHVQVFSQVGLPAAEIERFAPLPPPIAPPIRFISVSHLTHWKGCHLGLRAFALAQKHAVMDASEYWVVGDGPERRRLPALAKALRISEQVCFWGGLPRPETLQRMGECHALVHPSFHDSGGWVCIEMMAAGRPVICLDLGGPALQVTDATGFRIPASNPAQVVRDLAAVMVKLAQDPALLKRVGQAARHRVQQAFNWQIKGEHLAELQKTVVEQQKLLI